MTKKFSINRLLVVLLIPLASFSMASSARAIDIKDAAVEVRNDFVLEPAKTEVYLKPGEKVTKTLSVVNRTDREQVFTVEVEDFTGSKDPNQVVLLLGNDRSPYSLKDYIKPEVNSFKLKSKQRAVLSVTISIPTDAEPGGHYGSVLVSSAPSDSNSEDTADNKSRTISRLGALYFVRVAGKVNEDGKLTDFKLGKNKQVYEQPPVDFELLFENNSSVHLTPSGYIEIKNMLGRTVDRVDVPSFFSLPNSVRGAQATWGSGFSFGRYTATAHISRGYKENPDVTDTKTVVFWVLPWKVVLGILIAAVFVFFIIRRLMGSFEIKRRK